MQVDLESISKRLEASIANYESSAKLCDKYRDMYRSWYVTEKRMVFINGVAFGICIYTLIRAAIIIIKDHFN